MLSVNAINSFYGRAHILHNVSFNINEGEVVSLLGRNGAGKTTTIKSIMQLVKPEDGTVMYGGKNLCKLPTFKVARLGVGYVPEERRIFTDLTIIENLEVGRQQARNDTAWTMDALFELFPNLYERRNNRAKSLSGGEQQMLSIARTLMGNPRMLLLDEPSEGIAPVIVEQMAKSILDLKNHGISVLLSEQNLHFARLVSDRAIIIESGVKKFDSTFAELEANPEISSSLLSV